MPDDQPKTFSELLAEAAERDGFKVEWLSGKIAIQASASAFHSLIVYETTIQLPREKWWGLSDLSVGTPGEHRGPQPDIVLVPAGALRQDENPIRKELVAAVFEVVSRSTRAEDFVDKPGIYANMGIPIYVIIDRRHQVVRVFSEPEGEEYSREAVSPFGKPYALPAPVGLTIETTAYPFSDG
jgi:Uma2 family endonuclease